MAQGEMVVHEEAESDFIIDTDFHLQIPTEKLYPYIEDSMIREKLEKRGPPDFKNVAFKSSYANAFNYSSGGHIRPLGEAFDTKDIVEVMGDMALDAVIVTPGTHMPFMTSPHPLITNALVRAYNDYVLENVIDIEQSVYGLFFIPHWDVDAALAEMERVGSEPGFVGVQNWLINDRLWGDIEYDPIFEQLSELELPLFLHTSLHNTPHAPQLIRQSMRTRTEKLFMKMGYSVMANALNMIMTGVFEEYPDINVVLQEAGVNWIPYVAWRADELYQSYPEDIRLSERQYRQGDEYLDRMPSEYLFDNFFVSTQPIPFPNTKPRSDAKHLLKACHGADMFVYSSDWPHGTADPANWLYNMPIDEETRAKITHENAQSIIRHPE